MSIFISPHNFSPQKPSSVSSVDVVCVTRGPELNCCSNYLHYHFEIFPSNGHTVAFVVIVVKKSFITGS